MNIYQVVFDLGPEGDEHAASFLDIEKARAHQRQLQVSGHRDVAVRTYPIADAPSVPRDDSVERAFVAGWHAGMDYLQPPMGPGPAQPTSVTEAWERFTRERKS